MIKTLLCSDYTMTMLKSCPAGHVPSRTADERLFDNLQPEVITTRESCMIQLQHEQVEYAKDGIQISHPYGLYIDFPGEKVTKHICFGLATLVSHPSNYDPALQKWFEIDVDVEFERCMLLKSGMDLSHNNLTDQILMGRFLYSLVPKPLPEGRKNWNGIRFFRDTEGNLPAGDYVFDVKWVMLETCSYGFDRQALNNKLGCQGNRYKVSKLMDEKPPALSVYPNSDRVTIVLTKSSHNSKGGSVETTKSKGKKQKNGKGKDAPGPQLGM